MDILQNIFDLPPELLDLVGRHLKPRSLATCLRVSRKWKKILEPQVWRSVSRFDWHQEGFPITVPPDNEEGIRLDRTRTRCWTRNIRSVRHLEWHNNDSLDRFYPRHLVQDEIPPRLLFRVFRRVLLVTSVTIQMTGVIDFHPEPILALNALVHCQKASISIYFVPGEDNDQVPIRDMFPLLGRVQQLELHGNWYLPLDSVPDPQPDRPWKAKEMRLEANNICLAGKAVELTQLCVAERRSSFSTSLQDIRNCKQLEELILDRPGVIAQFSMLAVFKKLREVAFHLTSVSQIACLTMAPPNPSFNFPTQPRAQLPHLQYLTIKSGNLATASERTACSRNMGKVLQLYTGLRFVRVHGIQLNAESIFSGHRWSCMQLTDLRIELAPLVDMSDIKRLELWRGFYAQLGRLAVLRVLSVICTDIARNLEAGLNALNGAQELTCVTLSDRSQTRWTQEDVTNLLGAVPALRYIDVHPLPLENHRQVAAWVRDIDHHIVVNFIDNGNETQ
ncbi:hypothetical protein BGX33_005211 [Mortierella sp. NVP41]|nr:hypothetical protein BGX33_005211 [Mortierella sp. NVP41]